jgi:hypothetical protein
MPPIRWPDEPDSEDEMMKRAQRQPEFKIVPDGARFKIIDKNGKFRCRFPTRTEAEVYISNHTTRRQPRMATTEAT